MRYQKLHWTDHSKLKMRQYGISKSKVMAILRRPQRIEAGIAPGTTALMAAAKSYAKQAAKRPPGEIWLMYADANHIRKIISVWRYPGVSKPGEHIPIPQEIREELLITNAHVFGGNYANE